VYFNQNEKIIIVLYSLNITKLEFCKKTITRKKKKAKLSYSVPKVTTISSTVKILTKKREQKIDLSVIMFTKLVMIFF